LAEGEGDYASLGISQSHGGLPAYTHLKLLADRKTVRLQLPPLPLPGLSEPLDVSLDLSAAAVDEILRRLTELRVQMMPPPRRN
jgi:hypothetical protein